MLTILGKHVANRIIRKVKKIQHKNAEFGHKQGDITQKNLQKSTSTFLGGAVGVVVD
jgi:hypothetical protein